MMSPLPNTVKKQEIPRRDQYQINGGSGGFLDCPNPVVLLYDMWTYVHAANIPI